MFETVFNLKTSVQSLYQKVDPKMSRSTWYKKKFFLDQFGPLLVQKKLFRIKLVLSFLKQWFSTNFGPKILTKFNVEKTNFFGLGEILCTMFCIAKKYIFLLQCCFVLKICWAGNCPCGLILVQIGWLWPFFLNRGQFWLFWAEIG